MTNKISDRVFRAKIEELHSSLKNIDELLNGSIDLSKFDARHLDKYSELATKLVAATSQVQNSLDNLKLF